MLRWVRYHGLDIDAHKCTELQLLLVHKRFGRAYLCACVRSRRDWLRTKHYQRVHEFIFINIAYFFTFITPLYEDDECRKQVIFFLQKCSQF